MRGRSLGSLGLALVTLGFSLAAICEPVILGQRLSVHSESMGEQRTYLVHRPANYDISTARYPVLYVTDGNEHFEHVSATVDFLAAAGRIPPMIVVGIPNVNRGRDLLGYLRVEGASPLLKFITRELAPKIEADYRTVPYRILYGWSDGGLFVLHSLVASPQAFRGYISLATALGDDPAMPGKLRTFFTSHPQATLTADVYMGMDDVTNRALGRAYDAASVLQERAGGGRDLRFNFHYYADEGHMAVAMRGARDGLESIFAGWVVDDPFALYGQGGLQAIEKHYAALSDRLGFAVAIPLDTLFSTFNRLEEQKRYAEAEPVIQRAVDLYPQNLTALYYQGRLQIDQDKKDRAIEILRKALLLSPDDGGVRDLLKRLQVDPTSLVAATHATAKDLVKLVGRYGGPSPVFVVEQRGDRLIGRTQEQDYELTAVSATRFHWSQNNVYSDGGALTFRVDSAGRVTALKFDDGPEFARVR